MYCEIHTAVAEALSWSPVISIHIPNLATVGQRLSVKRRIGTGVIPRSSVAGTGQCIPASHLSVSRRASCEEVIGGLAAEGGLALLTAARPLSLHHGTRMKVHQHVSIEVASCVCVV